VKRDAMPEHETVHRTAAPLPAPAATPWQAGLRSARANLAPGLALQVGALALVLGYYFYPPVTAALAQLTVWRAEVGVVFSVGSTALCGGLLPMLYLKARRATRDRHTWTQGVALVVFWGYKGFEIDLWYRFLAWFVGAGHDLRTIALKTFLDEFVYCPLVAVPLTVLVYEWVETRFDAAAVLADTRAPRWYARRVLPMLLANLGVWVPAVAIIYALPTPLQLPLQKVVLCFFTLLLAHLAQRPISKLPVENPV
jgi:hypothetical protein